MVLRNPLHDKTNKDETQQPPAVCVSKGDNHHENYDVDLVRSKLELMKNHLCKSENEVDKFHPDWFTIPSDDAIKRKLLCNSNVEAAYEDILYEMYEPLLLGLRIKPNVNMKELLSSCKNDMRSLMYYLQATKLANAFNEKYNLSPCAGDIMEEYRESRMEGYGRLDTLGKIHLSCFGEYECAGSDDWDVDDASMVDIFR